jgi:hypothetical protein
MPLRKVRAALPVVSTKPSKDDLPLKRLEIAHVFAVDQPLRRKQ